VLPQRWESFLLYLRIIEPVTSQFDFDFDFEKRGCFPRAPAVVKHNANTVHSSSCGGMLIMYVHSKATCVAGACQSRPVARRQDAGGVENTAQHQEQSGKRNGRSCREVCSAAI
jgi:hypothetical protein